MNVIRSAYIRLIGFGFRLLYNEMAWTYDAVSWVVSLGEWRAWGRAALKHIGVPSGACVLEIAHGTGNLHLDLRTLGYHAIGFDLSRAMGRITTRKLQRARFAPQLVRGYAQQLPFADGALDAVLCTFPTNFIVDPATLRELYRVLKPGARFVCVPNAGFTAHTPATQSLDLLYRATGQRGTSEPLAASTGWMSVFTEAGFNVSVKVEPCRRSAAVVLIAEKPA
jgi:ubiquinone/menaquinone biosynthesis C-methylase UbiE